MVLVDWQAQQNEPKIHDIQTLGWELDAQVKEIFQRMAKQVQPIMRKRGWVVPIVKEFYPDQRNLLGLNVNGGGGRTSEIRIRARRAGDKRSILPEEQLLGTLLHELCHNVRGPHDNVFYKLLDEITEECEELLMKGITGTGAGFDGPSQGRLGAHSFIPQHNPPTHKLRSLAAEAAEARAKRMRLSGGGRLGTASGSSHIPWRQMTPAQAAAAAAERRAADDLWCPCGHANGPANGGTSSGMQPGPAAPVPARAGSSGGCQAGPSGKGNTDGGAAGSSGGLNAGNRAPAAVAGAAQAALARAAQQPNRTQRQGAAAGAGNRAHAPVPQQQQQKQPTSKQQQQQTATVVIDLTLGDDNDQGAGHTHTGTHGGQPPAQGRGNDSEPGQGAGASSHNTRGAAQSVPHQQLQGAKVSYQGRVPVVTIDSDSEPDEPPDSNNNRGPAITGAMRGAGGGGVSSSVVAAGYQAEWACSVCTYLNPASRAGGGGEVVCCSMCLTPRA